MGKLATHPRNHRATNKARMITRLREQQRKLSERMAALDRRLAKLRPANGDKKAPSAAALNRWLDELSDGLDHLPALPSDFSRADLYNEHD